jgi:hypothetical protein
MTWFLNVSVLCFSMRWLNMSLNKSNFFLMAYFVFWSKMESGYLCYYCNEKFDLFKDIFNHLIEKHNTETFKNHVILYLSYTVSKCCSVSTIQFWFDDRKYPFTCSAYASPVIKSTINAGKSSNTTLLSPKCY